MSDIYASMPLLMQGVQMLIAFKDAADVRHAAAGELLLLMSRVMQLKLWAGGHLKLGEATNIFPSWGSKGNSLMT